MRYPLLLMSLYCDACMFVWFVSERLHDATAALPVGMDRGCTEMEGNTGDVIVDEQGPTWATTIEPHSVTKHS